MLHFAARENEETDTNIGFKMATALLTEAGIISKSSKRNAKVQP